MLQVCNVKYNNSCTVSLHTYRKQSILVLRENNEEKLRILYTVSRCMYICMYVYGIADGDSDLD